MKNHVLNLLTNVANEGNAGELFHKEVASYIEEHANLVVDLCMEEGQLMVFTGIYIGDEIKTETRPVETAFKDLLFEPGYIGDDEKKQVAVSLRKLADLLEA